MTAETAGVLKGEYGATPAPLDAALQQKVLDGAEPITGRPADLLEPEVERLTNELRQLSQEEGITLASAEIDDVLTYALFPQVGLKFLKHRGDASAFEPAPGAAAEPASTAPAPAPQAAASGTGVYTVKVNGQPYVVEVSEGGEVTAVAPSAAAPPSPPAVSSGGDPVPAPLAGNVFKVLVNPGQQVAEGETIIVLEAMKMETEVSAPRAGTVTAVSIAEGDAVAVGDTLLSLA